MSILTGMYEPEEGEILIRGKKEKIKSPNYAFSLNIGMVYQHFKLVENFTAAENIVMGIEPKRRFLGVFPCIDLKKANREIKELAESYRLPVKPTDKIEDLSVSARQKVEILKILYRKAEILIFDEPTAVLTPQEIEELLRILQELRADGKTILFITHKLEEIKKVADRCAIMRKGKLIDVLNAADTSTQTMADLMVGRKVSLSLEKEKGRFSDPILRVEDLTVRDCSGFEKVRKASFTIHRGEIFAIAGVSGNGQNELVEAVAGLRKPGGGRILLNGKDITGQTVRQRFLEGISYVPEDRHSRGLVLDMTVEENLVIKDYFRHPYSRKGRINRKSMEENALRLMEEYDIRSGQGKDTVVRSMSGGNQQKVIIAREIEAYSELLIFMQPTRGVDIGAIENIHKQIIRERDKGKAILLVSLELDEVMKCADTIGIIYDGEVLKIAPADELTEQEIGKYMMGVKRK